VAFQRGLNDEALRHWTEAEKLTKPGSDQQAYLLVNIGLAHARAKNYEEAISIASQQIENGAQIIDINMDDGMLDAEKEMVEFLVDRTV